MLTLLASLFGFLSSAFPDFLKLFQDARDKKHELAILALQKQQQQQGHLARLEEINAQADIAEAKHIGKRIQVIGIPWVDALNATVRPVIAYAFFALYACIKVMVYCSLPDLATVPVSLVAQVMWTEEDAAIFAAIISFYFGQRAMNKVRAAR